MKKRLFVTILALVLAASTLLSGCKKEDSGVGSGFYVYFLHPTKRELYPVESELDPQWSLYNRILSVWKYLSGGGDRSTYMSPVPTGVSLNLKDFEVDGGNLVLNFDTAYNSISGMNEVLFRAAVVKTYTQFPELETVEFKVDGRPLTLSGGTTPGAMKGSDFIDIFGTGLSAYSEATVRVYFTNEEGTKLIGEDDRIMYDSNVPLEVAVIRKLIDGPTDANLHSCLPAETKLLSQSTKNGCCYLNFSDSFLKDATVRPEIAIYSIVNSMTEITGIDSVMITLNGNTPSTLYGTVDLSKPLYRNMDLNGNDAEDETTESE